MLPLLLAFASLLPAGGGAFTAVDYAWRANGTDATALTIAPGETVTFGYPDGTSSHNVEFTGPKPSSCDGLAAFPQSKGWQGSCTFADAGTYPFLCIVHQQMKGTVVVVAPSEPTPSPSPTATPGPPVGSATPAPTATPAPAPAATLKVKLSAKQRGTRVRGTVDVRTARSRIEVTVRAGRARVGHLVKTPSAVGTAVFSVTLDAKTRRNLRREHRLALSVTVALTAPGQKTLTRRVKVTLRPG
jgi:plastocyanin